MTASCDRLRNIASPTALVAELEAIGTDPENSARSSACFLKKERVPQLCCLKKRARAYFSFARALLYETPHGLSSPEAAHGPFNRKASEWSSIKIQRNQFSC